MKTNEQTKYKILQKNNISSFLILISIVIILFLTLTTEFTVVFVHPEDGRWLRGDKIHGFPLPFVYNGINSLSKQIIGFYFIIDIIIYFCLVILIYLLSKKIFFKLGLQIKKNIKTIILFLTSIIAIILIVLHIIPLVFGVYFITWDISWGKNYYGDLIKFHAIYFGFYIL